MNKKGFTLVELLAVVSILSLLVIIALPNIMSLFNEAKKNAYETELKNIYKAAQQQWMSDSLFSTNEVVYSNCDGCSGKKLKLSGRSEIKYYIKIDKSGCVNKYNSDDGTYRYEHSGSCLLITDITGSAITTSTGEEINSANYVYAVNYPEIKMGYAIPSSITTYNSYNEVVNATGESAFMRYGIENSIVSSISVGFLHNGRAYYIVQGNDTFSTNKTNLMNAFGASNCFVTESSIDCGDDNVSVTVEPNNDWIVVTSGIGWYCKSEYYSFRSYYYGRCDRD